VTVTERVEPRRAQVHGVDRRELLDHALGHAPDALWRGGELLGEAALVDGAVEAFHHIELAPEHVAGALEPQRARRAHRSRLDGAQDAELPVQVVGLE
jgi:hypothetical protein